MMLSRFLARDRIEKQGRMDHDAFNIRVVRSLAEMQAKLEQILDLLQPKAPEVLPSALQPSPSAPLQNPWDDFVI
jgi:hypothetical protein